MKKYIILTLVAVMAFGSFAPAFAREEENRGKEKFEVKKEMREERRDEAKEKLEKALKIAPRAFTVAGTVTAVDLTTTTSSTGKLTIHVTKVLPGTPKHWPTSTVAYPEKEKDLVVTLTVKTTLLRAYGGKMKASEMAVGDEVRVVAKYTKEGVIEAKVVKDNSLYVILNRKGTVESIDAANGTFVLKQEKRTLTVKTNSNTKLTLKGAGDVAFSSLVVGDAVRVEGIVNLNSKTVDARAVVIAKRAVAEAQ